MQSHPVWVRGLKHAGMDEQTRQCGVAPCMGAWIETHSLEADAHRLESHPVWVRGLKLFSTGILIEQ